MSESAIGVGLIGCGTVGAGVVALLRDEAALYESRVGRRIELRRILVRDAAGAVKRLSESGETAVPPSDISPSDLVTQDVEAFFATRDMPIVIEAAGGVEPIGGYVRRALEAGKHVVTANKSLLAAQGAELFALARQHDAAIAFEASCGGGIPCLTALQFGLMANRIKGMYGILNGTCNYILTQMTRRGATYDAALASAQERGFAEADPTLDVSGRDAAQKLVILASLGFGARLSEKDIHVKGIDGLDLEDIHFGAELGYDIKLLAIAEGDVARHPQNGDGISVSVEPCFIGQEELLAQVRGSFNALSIYGHAVGHTMYYGQGAGRMPTASAVVGDLLNLVGGGYAQAFANMRLTPDFYDAPALVDPGDLESRFYLRVHALDVPGVMAKVTRLLGEAGISLSAVLQHESAAGQFVPVVITTHRARRGDVESAAAAIEQLDVIQGKPVVIRIVDIPG